MAGKESAHVQTSVELLDYRERDVVTGEAGGTARDAADMQRMGKRQQLQV